jgi:hypothetical protein
MNKTLLSSAVALALGLASVNALALVNMDDAVADAVPFAAEINRNTTPPQTLLSAALDVQKTLGFGFTTANPNIFVRYDLSNGTFNAALTSANLTVVGGTGITTVSLSQGGTAGSNYVIFNLQSTAAIPINTLVTLLLGSAPGPVGINVATSGNPTLKYRLFDNPTDAVNPEGRPTLASGEEALIAFTPAVSFTQTEAYTNTALVAEEFKKFKAQAVIGAPPATAPIDTTARLAKFSYVLTTPAPAAANGTAIPNIATVMDTTTSVKVEGDFTAVMSIGGSTFLSTDSSCPKTAPAGATNILGTIASGNQSATYPIGNVSPAPGDWYLCFAAASPNTLEIPVSTYKAAFIPVAQAGSGYDVSGDAKQDLAAGSILRDGAELVAPFFSNVEGMVARYYLTNKGPTAADFKIKVLSDAAANPPATAGSLTQGRIPAGATLMLKAGEVANGQRGAVLFQLSAQCQNIEGAYQINNAANGNFNGQPMVKPTACIP